MKLVMSKGLFTVSKGLFTVSVSVSRSVNASKWVPHPYPASASTFCTWIFDADTDANAHCE